MATNIFYIVLVFCFFFGGQVIATSCSAGQYFTGTTCKKVPANGLWNNNDPGLYKSGIYPYSRTLCKLGQKNLPRVITYSTVYIYRWVKM